MSEPESGRSLNGGESGDAAPRPRETTPSRFDCEYIVLGGGIGGLAAGALLAHAGEEVILLEAHSEVGGCAGFFDRYEKVPGEAPRRFRFDVGATTLSGVRSGEPLDRLFRELGILIPMRHIDPGMICHLPDGTRVIRHRDRERWIAECVEKFGSPGQRGFWEEVFRTNDRAWRLSAMNPAFPPKSLGDFFRMARPANLAGIGLLRHTWTSVLEVMRRHGVGEDGRFREFIDEQLLITAQNRGEDTPFLVGAMGLAYPEETWYPEGGMYALAEALERKILQEGGEVRRKRTVIAIRRSSTGWILETARGERYTARHLIANATIHDMARLIEGEEREWFRQLAGNAEGGWGAFTLYCAVADRFDDLGTLYHQIHTNTLPGCGSSSIFVSLSHPDDRLRAPQGWRTVTVSTHLTEPGCWEEMPRERYRDLKGELASKILRAIEGALPGFADAEKKFILTGTPRTFRRYTHRLHGMVGGVPHSVRRNMMLAQKHRTRFPGLYLVGDTVYPGQGTPAVVLGALNLAEELGRVNHR